MRRLLLALALSGCASPTEGPYQPRSEEQRDTVRAQALSREGAELIYTDPERAEVLLREALTADVFFGPAHNNLGVLYLSQNKLYEAANEFEWARKVMPGHPDPRLNLGITLERAGQQDEAIQSYKTALEVYPGHLPTQQALARLLARAEPDDPDLAGMLERIQLQGTSEAWREWARGRLAGAR